jgi:hypothetical protein
MMALARRCSRRTASRRYRANLNNQFFDMTAKFTQEANTERRETILLAARWCFLPSAFPNLAGRYRQAGQYLAHFAIQEFQRQGRYFQWLSLNTGWYRAILRRRKLPAAGAAYERLREVCRVMLEEPWKDMFGAPMSGDFYDVCERLNPEVANQR